jgi:hypothetical protein
MKEEFIRGRFIEANIDLLTFFASIENPKEKLSADTEYAIAVLFVLVEPGGGNDEFKDGDVGGIHALGIKTCRIKHEVDMFTKQFHVLKQGGKGLGLVFVSNEDMHF